jgi:hypothetical protein
MEHIAEKIRDLIVNAGEQFIVASVQGFHAIVFALLTVPECIWSATSLSQLAWDQVSSPGPHAPAGDLTLHLIKIWMNHVVEVVFPRVRSRATQAGLILLLIGMCCRLFLSAKSFPVQVPSRESKLSRLAQLDRCNASFNFRKSVWRMGAEEWQRLSERNRQLTRSLRASTFRASEYL